MKAASPHGDDKKVMAKVLGRKVEELQRRAAELGINLGVSGEKKEGGEQAGEEQQMREQHRVHAPSLKARW